MRFSLILSGLLFMALSSYLDNVRGPLLPEITHFLSLNYSESSWLFIAGNIGAVLTTFLMIPLTQAFSEKTLGIGVFIFSIFSLLTIKMVTGFPGLLLFAVLVGCSISMIGGMANVLVIQGSDVAHRSKALCLLHMMYGVGSLIAPLCVSYLIGLLGNWQSPFLILTPVLFLGAIYLNFTLPSKNHAEVIPTQSARLGAFQVFIILVFTLYVMGEVMTSMWLVTYLIEGKKLALSSASIYLTGFFVMMSITRGMVFFSMKPKYEKALILGCLFLTCVFFFLGLTGWYWGFALVGVAGPYFPLFLARVGKNFPSQVRPLTLWILGCNQLSLAISHTVIGKMTDKFGIEFTYTIPGLLLVISFVVSGLYFRLEKVAKN